MYERWCAAHHHHHIYTHFFVCDDDDDRACAYAGWCGDDGVLLILLLISCSRCCSIIIRRYVHSHPSHTLLCFAAARSTHLKSIWLRPHAAIMSGNGSPANALRSQQLVVDVILPAHVEDLLFCCCCGGDFVCEDCGTAIAGRLFGCGGAGEGKTLQHTHTRFVYGGAGRGGRGPRGAVVVMCVVFCACVWCASVFGFGMCAVGNTRRDTTTTTQILRRWSAVSGWWLGTADGGNARDTDNGRRRLGRVGLVFFCWCVRECAVCACVRCGAELNVCVVPVGDDD